MAKPVNDACLSVERIRKRVREKTAAAKSAFIAPREQREREGERE